MSNDERITFGRYHAERVRAHEEELRVTLNELRPDAPEGGVIVVTRHPDHETAVEVFGVEVQVINIDLGASFDAGYLNPESDRENVKEWAASLRREVEDLHPDHPARLSVEATVTDIEERVGLTETVLESGLTNE